MARALAALVALGLVWPAGAAGEPRTLAVPTLLGEYRLTFDDTRRTEAEIAPLVVLSPHLAGWTSLAVAPRLERCVVGEPDYLDCGTRTAASPGFLWNARVNLERGAAALGRLRALRAPAELAPVVAWFERSLAFSLWLEETRLEFYRTANVAVLARRYGDADPARDCAPVLAALAAAPREAQYDLAAHPWHNCVNDLVRQRLGAYPLAAWERFLTAYGITEEIVESQPPGEPAGERRP
jgi:hypothetical protein